MLPVVQGTSENAAFRIIKNGFGTVASVDDGYFGLEVFNFLVLFFQQPILGISILLTLRP